MKKQRDRWEAATQRSPCHTETESTPVTPGKPPCFSRPGEETRGLRAANRGAARKLGRRPTTALVNVKRTFWSPNWSRTRDHGSVLNGTDRHARPIFTIQINTCQDRTKRVETAAKESGAFEHSAYSRWLQKKDLFGLAAFVRHCARPQTLG